MEEHYSPAEEPEAEKNSPFLTKNVLNKNTSSGKFEISRLQGKETFCKQERLTNRTIIDKLFAEGKSIHKNGFALLYLPCSLHSIFPVQISFAVPKRNFKHAHDRNKIKRLMRECWRKQKNHLYASLPEEDGQVAFCWMFKGKELPNYSLTEKTLAFLIKKFLEDYTKLLSKA